ASLLDSQPWCIFDQFLFHKKSYLGRAARAPVCFGKFLEFGSMETFLSLLVSSIRKRSRSTRTAPNAYAERHQMPTSSVENLCHNENVKRRLTTGLKNIHLNDPAVKHLCVDVEGHNSFSTTIVADAHKPISSNNPTIFDADNHHSSSAHKQGIEKKTGIEFL
nr:hypothetical protein [Tanacetum cinerariifolium]